METKIELLPIKISQPYITKYQPPLCEIKTRTTINIKKEGESSLQLQIPYENYSRSREANFIQFLKIFFRKNTLFLFIRFQFTIFGVLYIFFELFNSKVFHLKENNFFLNEKENFII